MEWVLSHITDSGATAGCRCFALVEFVGERFFFDTSIVFHLAIAFIFLFVVYWRRESAILQESIVRNVIHTAGR